MFSSIGRLPSTVRSQITSAVKDLYQPPKNIENKGECSKIIQSKIKKINEIEMILNQQNENLALIKTAQIRELFSTPKLHYIQVILSTYIENFRPFFEIICISSDDPLMNKKKEIEDFIASKDLSKKQGKEIDSFIQIFVDFKQKIREKVSECRIWIEEERKNLPNFAKHLSLFEACDENSKESKLLKIIRENPTVSEKNIRQGFGYACMGQRNQSVVEKMAQQYRPKLDPGIPIEKQPEPKRSWFKSCLDSVVSFFHRKPKKTDVKTLFSSAAGKAFLSKLDTVISNASVPLRDVMPTTKENEKDTRYDKKLFSDFAQRLPRLIEEKEKSDPNFRFTGLETKNEQDRAEKIVQNTALLFKEYYEKCSRYRDEFNLELQKLEQIPEDKRTSLIKAQILNLRRLVAFYEAVELKSYSVCLAIRLDEALNKAKM